MTDFVRSYAISIEAPVPVVFDYCRDPARIFAGNPKVDVREVVMTPDGVGTTAHVVAKHGGVVEDVRWEYVEFVVNERIVAKAHPRMVVAGMTKEITHGPTWTWTFAPENGGARLTLVFLEQDAPWWQRLFDVATERGWSQEINGWLTGVKVGAEAVAGT